MSSNPFWLYEWMDSYMVTSVKRAIALLQKPEPFAALRDIAAEAAEMTSAATPAGDVTIVAGANLDLSRNFGCSHWECRKKQVDRLFNQVWHYFDRIIIVGVGAREMTNRFNYLPRDELISGLEHDIRLALYVRNIGAESLVVFGEKPPLRVSHWRKHARENGLEAALSEVDRFARFLTKEAEIDVEDHADHFGYRLWHPIFYAQFTGGPIAKDASVAATRRKAARRVAAECSAQLVSDIETARLHQSSLGTDFGLHKRMLRSIKAKPSEADVAFHLRLPVLDGIEPELLLRIRSEEQVEFEAFRNSLRAAIRERLRSTDQDNAVDIALEIKSDLIEPALNDIGRRLARARNAIEKKAGLSVGLGALITTCGILTANPLITTTGVGTMATTVGAAHKYIEERRDIALSDMYFLWHAQRHAQGGW